jgi:hypothetical protein
VRRYLRQPSIALRSFFISQRLPARYFNCFRQTKTSPHKTRQTSSRAFLSDRVGGGGLHASAEGGVTKIGASSGGRHASLRARTLGP